MECTKCGTELDFREVFCSKCGEVTDRGKGAGELAGRYAAELADGFGKMFAAAWGYATNPVNRLKVGAGTGAALLLLISITNNPISRGVGSMFASTPDAPTFNDDGTPNFAEYEDHFLSFEAEYLVTGPANVRDYPTSQGTKIVGSLDGGERIAAREVRAFDSSSRWFALEGGGYIWGGNLEGIGQPADSTPSLRESAFPPWSQGQWSSKDFCPQSNGGSIYVVIEGDLIYVNGNGSQISNQFQDAAATIYNIKPIDAQDQFDMTISLRRSADGRYIVLEHIEPHEIEPWILFEEDLPCNQLMRN